MSLESAEDPSKQGSPVDPLPDAEIVDIPDPIEGRISEGTGPRQELINYRILRSLRQIMQAVDLHSRHLRQVYSITGPQLVCLLAISERGSATLSEVAQTIYLSPSTVVGIIDRLEREGFVQRVRSKQDRRVVLISITARGKKFVAKAPSPIQEELEERLSELEIDEQMLIAQSLEKVAELMGAERIDAAPVLQTGEISKAP